MTFLELNGENLNIYEELSEERWGDKEILDDIQIGAFPHFSKKSSQSDESSVSSETGISDTGSTVSEVTENSDSSTEEWTQVEKKPKQSYKNYENSRNNFSLGRIKMWNYEKGYGYVIFEKSNENIDFITSKNAKSKDTYLHVSEISEKDRQFVAKGRKIKFNLNYDNCRKNTFARNVKVL